MDANIIERAVNAIVAAGNGGSAAAFAKMNTAVSSLVWEGFWAAYDAAKKARYPDDVEFDGLRPSEIKVFALKEAMLVASTAWVAAKVAESWEGDASRRRRQGRAMSRATAAKAREASRAASAAKEIFEKAEKSAADLAAAAPIFCRGLY